MAREYAARHQRGGAARRAKLKLSGVWSSVQSAQKSRPPNHDRSRPRHHRDGLPPHRLRAWAPGAASVSPPRRRRRVSLFPAPCLR